MNVPAFLRPGDTVGLVACGKKVSRGDMEHALRILASWGVDVIEGAHLYSEAHAYMAGTDRERLSDFQFMVDNPAVKAILCARGGYGSTRIVDEIDFSNFVKNPKWVVGFSDITAIHLKLLRLGVASIHGIMPVLFSKPAAKISIESLRRALFGGPDAFTLQANPGNRHGTATGRLLGGNLALICDALGTSSEPDTNGAILVLEEVEEYRYKIDRLLTQLKRAGKLQGLAGMLVGHMTDILDSQVSFGETVPDMVLHHTRSFGYPVVFQFPTGHEDPNLAWIHGATVRLSVNTSGATVQLQDILQEGV